VQTRSHKRQLPSTEDEFLFDSSDSEGHAQPLTCRLGGCNSSKRRRCFKNRRTLQEHWRKYHPGHSYAEKRGDPHLPDVQSDQYRCQQPGCGRSYISVKACQRHFRDKHTDFAYNPLDVKCPKRDCKRIKIFANPQSCAAHIRNKHPELWPAERERRTLARESQHRLTKDTDPVGTRDIAKFIPRDTAERLTAGIQSVLRISPTRRDAFRSTAYSDKRVSVCVRQYRHLFGLIVAGRICESRELEMNVFSQTHVVQKIYALLERRAQATAARKGESTTQLSAKLRASEFHYQLTIRMLQAISYQKEIGGGEQASEVLLTSEEKRLGRLRKGAGKKARYTPVEVLVDKGKWIEHVSVIVMSWHHILKYY